MGAVHLTQLVGGPGSEGVGRPLCFHRIGLAQGSEAQQGLG